MARHGGGWHWQLSPGFSRGRKGCPGDRLCSEHGFGGKVQLLAVRGTAGQFVIKLSLSRGPSWTPCGQRLGRPWCNTVSGMAAGRVCTVAAQLSCAHHLQDTALGELLG